MSDKEQKKAEREARELYEAAIERLREGTYRFSSKVRGQAGTILDELIDPDGESVMSMADFEGDMGALALATPIDLITFETWLFGQIGDQDELDLDVSSHRELWFNFGAWIGEALRRRHGGHWLIGSDDPDTWRMGFSKIMLEVVPFTFARNLLESGQGAVRTMLSEFERLREQHDEQAEKDGGQEIDRFTSQHYVRLHTIPLGQWMVMDFELINRLWHGGAVSELSREIEKARKRLGPGNEAIIDQILEALKGADQTKPLGEQASDRGLFEAVCQIIGLRRTAAPIAMDVLEEMVVPAMHVGVPDKFPPLDDDDLTSLRKGIELFSLFIEVVPHKYPADDDGFLKAVPHDELRTPYGDRHDLELHKGDWVMIDPKWFKAMLVDFDSKRMLTKYDEFVKYVASNPKAPRRRDDGRMLAETVAASIADLKACVVAASKAENTLLFRMLPPPA